MGKKHKKKIRSENGSITIFVIVSMLFMVIALLLLYSRVMNNKTAENRQIKQLESQYSVSNEQMATAYTDAFGKLTVTFDANGGQVSTSSKEVNYGSTYGTLPTPTRNGYTFKGWNGKNLFNEEYVDTNNMLFTEFIDKKIIFDGSGVDNNISYSITFQKYNNTQYLSTYHRDTFSIGRKSFLLVKDSTYNFLIIKENTSKRDPYFKYSLDSFKNDYSYTISYNIDSYDSNNAKATISDLQMEDGDEATEYEPYYVTSSTKVTQTKDHTLTAIWEEE